MGVGRGVTTICQMNGPREYSDHPRNLNSLCKARVAKDPNIFMWTAKTDQTARIVQSCRTEILCLGLFIFFFAN